MQNEAEKKEAWTTTENERKQKNIRLVRGDPHTGTIPPSIDLRSVLQPLVPRCIPSA
jgi:hypothetical protein